MSGNMVGPLVGVGVSLVCSSLGVLTARYFGGDVTGAATLIHAAAAVVLLVTILERLTRRAG